MCKISFLVKIILQFVFAVSMYLIAYHIIKKNGSEKYKFTLPVWFLFTVATILMLNFAFVVFRCINLDIGSELNYANTQLMLGSIIPAVCVAFFQYKIQVQLEINNNDRHAKEQQWHEDELRTVSLQAINRISRLSGFAINFHLPSSRGVHTVQIDDDVNYYIELNSDLDRDASLYPDYFEVKSFKVSIKSQMMELNDPDCMETSFHSNRLILKLKKGNFQLDNIVNEFFIAAATLDKATNLTIRLEINAWDTSRRGVKDEHSFLYIRYFTEFNLVIDKGYDENGKFNISVDHCKLGLLI